jgi:hypothetical protein
MNSYFQEPPLHPIPTRIKPEQRCSYPFRPPTCFLRYANIFRVLSLFHCILRIFLYKMWRISRLTCYAKHLNCTRVICKALSTSAPNLFVNKTRCHSTSVSKEEIQSFQENGAVCLRGKFSPEWLEKIKKGIRNIFANPSPFGEKLAHQDNPKCIYFNDYCNYHKVNEFSNFVFDSPASELARQLMGSEVIYLVSLPQRSPNSNLWGIIF